jgi:hypothetical protein
MMPPDMRLDPKGYYARLEVPLWASHDAIHAAYRHKARLLHPDNPETGDAEAFVAMKEAYEVLANPLSRAAYDRQARAQPQLGPRAMDEAEEIHPPPPPPMPPLSMRHPRITDLPILLWLGLGGIGVLAAVQVVLHLASPAPPASHTTPITANAPRVQPLAPPAPAVPVQLAGAPNAYILPAGGAAVVWRHDTEHDTFQPIGRLPPFSAVQVIGMVREKGLLEVRLSQDGAGFIDASRLTPGNAEAAHQAYCAYNAGPLPNNGEVLARTGGGPAALTLINHSGQPAVVKLRTAQGETAATVYLEPNGSARVDGLPAGSYRPDYAIGELWSRACGSFAAGMRAQRFAGSADIAHLSPLTIPPDLSDAPVPVDIPDKEFERP